MRGGALRYYRPQGQLGRGFGGLLKRGLKRGLQLVKPDARKALNIAHKPALKYAKQQGIPLLEREAKKRYPALNRRLLKEMGDQSGSGMHRRKRRRTKKRRDIFTY